MEILLWSSIFVAAVALLVWSADRFVEASEKIGLILGVPQFVIGLTVVAVGTSLPELATSFVAVYYRQTEFVVGNALGSNITNILLILGAAAVVGDELKIRRDLGGLDLPLLLITTGLSVIFGLTNRSVGLGEGLILVLAYGLYLVFLALDEDSHQERSRPDGAVAAFFWLVGSVVGIFFGAEYTLKATVKLSALLGWGDTSVLALTAVALGTSLPELLVSIIAARRGNMDLSVGNIVGSNIFNVLIVVGLPALLTPLQMPDPVVYTGLPYLGLATLLCYLTLIRRRIERPMGFFFLLLYAAYLAELYGLI